VVLLNAVKGNNRYWFLSTIRYESVLSVSKTQSFSVLRQMAIIVATAF